MCCSLQPAVAPNAEDQEALLTVRGIWSILQPSFNQQLDGNQRQQVWDELYPILPELLPGLGLTGMAEPAVYNRWHILRACNTSYVLSVLELLSESLFRSHA